MLWPTTRVLTSVLRVTTAINQLGRRIQRTIEVRIGTTTSSLPAGTVVTQDVPASDSAKPFISAGGVIRYSGVVAAPGQDSSDGQIVRTEGVNEVLLDALSDAVPPVAGTPLFASETEAGRATSNVGALAFDPIIIAEVNDSRAFVAGDPGTRIVNGLLRHCCPVA